MPTEQEPRIKRFLRERENVNEYLKNNGDFAAMQTGHALDECKSLVQLLTNDAHESLLWARETYGKDSPEFEGMEIGFRRLGIELYGGNS